MTCKKFTSSITDYLDDALSSRHREEFGEHLVKCPNCRSYFEQMNQLIRAAPGLRDPEEDVVVPPGLYELLADKSQRHVAERHSYRILYKPLLIAIAVSVVLAGVWLYRSHYAAHTPVAAATIDLTKWLRLRGVDQTSHTTMQLRRAELDLTVDLPITAEPGAYEVGIASAKGEPFIVATGTARVINRVVTLRVKLDLTRVSSGSYRFTVRRGSSDWTYFPLRIK